MLEQIYMHEDCNPNEIIGEVIEKNINKPLYFRYAGHREIEHCYPHSLGLTKAEAYETGEVILKIEKRRLGL